MKDDAMASLDMGDEGSTEEERAESPDDEQSEKDMHLSDAFDAIEKGDKSSFMESMRKCLLLSDEGGYTVPDGEKED